jgi:hypothetical protein
VNRPAGFLYYLGTCSHELSILTTERSGADHRSVNDREY